MTNRLRHPGEAHTSVRNCAIDVSFLNIRQEHSAPKYARITRAIALLGDSILVSAIATLSDLAPALSFKPPLRLYRTQIDISDFIENFDTYQIQTV